MSDAISFNNGTDGGVRSAGEESKKSNKKSRKKEEEIIPLIFFLFFSIYLVMSKSLYRVIRCFSPRYARYRGNTSFKDL